MSKDPFRRLSDGRIHPSTPPSWDTRGNRPHQQQHHHHPNHHWSSSYPDPFPVMTIVTAMMGRTGANVPAATLMRMMALMMITMI
jgi:hypothetical protein